MSEISARDILSCSDFKTHLFRLFWNIIIAAHIELKSPNWYTWPSGLRRGSTAACLLGLLVRIPLRAWMFVCCECYVLWGRGLCDGPIPRPVESYRLWLCDCVCDLETSRMRRPWPVLGLIIIITRDSRFLFAVHTLFINGLRSTHIVSTLIAVFSDTPFPLIFSLVTLSYLKLYAAVITIFRI